LGAEEAGSDGRDSRSVGEKVDLARATTFLSRLRIRDRDSHRLTPFLLNPNQRLALRKMEEQASAGRPIRVIFDKSRRVGVSSLSDSLMFAHCLALEGASALVVAHDFKTSRELFRLPHDLAKQVPMVEIESIEREIRFKGRRQESTMQVLTAGKDTSGRGFTLSALHLSECAFYESENVTTSLIPAVSGHSDTMIFIESTPNGKEGKGRLFYELWLDAVEGRSEYVPVFLSWLDDPGCFAEASIAEDAPIDDEERSLIKHFHATKAQLAWRRQKISSPECRGLVDIFHQEYPTSWEESFVASGAPAFESDEIRWVEQNVKPPIDRGFLEMNDASGQFRLRKSEKGDLVIWEKPREGHYYYIGADAARGDYDPLAKSGEPGDFAAATCINGTTGQQAFRYAARVVPEVFASFLSVLGLRYNKAMINPELTGGYGATVLTTLRDIYQYPNFYFWRGKDDAPAYRKRRHLLGFETTYFTRRLIFEMFRILLREAAASEGEHGVTMYDEELLHQMRQATRHDDGRWEVERGHDDILMSGLLACIALRQWAPPRISNRTRTAQEEEDEQVKNVLATRGDRIFGEPPEALKEHVKKLKVWERRMRGRDRLEGL
jgi:hypothetical protein